jgi:mannose/cellobiose epimerase-like protein (N-acyl-D-glucosamine 2-epimerase family)
MRSRLINKRVENIKTIRPFGGALYTMVRGVNDRRLGIVISVEPDRDPRDTAYRLWQARGSLRKMVAIQRDDNSHYVK